MSVNDLYDACQKGTFPTLATMTRFGLNNHNPVEIFNMYRTAIQKDGITKEDLEKHFKSGNLNRLLLEQCQWVKSRKNYEKILQKGGIKCSEDLPQRECQSCQLNSIHKDICSNCNKCVT